ncbi:MAG: DUF6502 family protein [Proteobacteria bacterium]|nr:DUF6502 family protein [Pseudomonadota bacterium]
MGLEKLNKLLSYMAYRIFRPLVILFLRNSIPYQTASDWLKRVYIDTAFDNKEFRINPAKKQTKTRVAVLTGLSRVEIDRVLKIEKPLEATEQQWNRALKVLSGWCNDADYLDEKNIPKNLNIYGDLSFSSLVEKYSGGATMRSVLDELVYVQSVETHGDIVKLIRQDYIQSPDKQRLVNLEISGMCTGDLLNTLVFNDKELDKNKRRFQKVVLWDIPDRNIQEAKNFIYIETDKLLISIDNKLATLNNNLDSLNTSRIGLGAYYFKEKKQ